ncbi:hypothetical protein [Methylosinus sp. Ce-a6]|uniref:hypothetical protein n=1 Tax=Methylosinus sp. Ce-a6 TaxID=2172005 RepID=UPI001FCEA9B4|nr:hypothetical protein [Methylosinus sp. Ce-a6]
MARSMTGVRLSLVAALALLALALFPGRPALAEEELLRSFRQGGDVASVGVVEAGADTEIEGPQAIYSGGEGEIYLLDQVNGRVLRFDPRKPAEATRSLELPSDLRPTDIVVARDTIYVWDEGPRALQATGPEDAQTRSLAVTRSVAAPDEATLSAFAQTGSQEIDDEATRSLGAAKPMRARQTIASHGRGQVVADVSPLDKKGVSISLQIKDGAALAKLKMQVRSRIGSVEVLDVDHRGRTFVLGENIPTDATDQPSTFVARYAANGALEGVYELPLDSRVALSRRFVTVSPEGDVYFLRTRKGAVDLLGVGFRPMKNGQVIDLAPPAPSYSLTDFGKRKGAAAAVRPLDRTQVIQTALQFANVRWRVNAGAYGADPDRACSGFARIRRPGYLHGKLGQEVVGIPYCWGCHGALPRIAAAIGAGRLAGNVCTRNDPRPDVAGVDCSAFVSACWGLSTHFTTMAIPAISRELSNPWDLLPGDALNKPGSHVMLFMRFTPDRRAEVIESSTGGCNGKVCRNIYPLGSLLARGYRPVRFRGLANDLSAPTPVAAVTTATPMGRTKPEQTRPEALDHNGAERPAKGAAKTRTR